MSAAVTHRPAGVPVTSDAEPLVAAEDVSLTLGGRLVLRDVSFHVRPGEVVGLVGRNGAGKTTLLHVLLGLVRPDRGRVSRIAGVGAVGVAFDSLAAPSVRTVEEALRTVRRYVTPGDGGLDAAELVGDVRGDRLRHLSHGQRQRLSVAQAVVGEPALVVLDEPYNGLDPVAMDDLGRLVRARAARGAGVVLSTHYVAALDDLCDRVVLVEEGRVVLDAAIGDLVRTTGYQLECADPDAAGELLRGQGLAVARGAGDRLDVQVDEPGEAASALRTVVAAGIDVWGLRVLRRSLADVVAERLGREAS